ncbi:hypothetical protein G6F56_010076 [Rhizopus delemar]|nr:hypothetical protein G6F56_010076 [Rhizopus delemar]
MVNEMIQDRRLIATLVASQASIFCPLFLLMNTHGENKKPSTALVIEQFFQCLMPIGLVISWCFCIGFDRNVKAVLGIEDHWMEVLLRYSVVAVLMVEILLIWTESLNCLLAVHKEGNIRLPDEECAILEKELE